MNDEHYGFQLFLQVLAVRESRVDSAIHLINHYSVDKCYQNLLSYPLDSDLCSG